MSTTPPEGPQPTQPGGQAGGQRGYGYTAMTPGGIARLPIPGNAEYALYTGVLIFLIILWIFSKSVDTGDFAIFLVALTFGYFISRGIAKAGRVLEQ